MKTIDFTPIPGKGFPLDENTLLTVQQEVFDVQDVSLLGGNLYILKGCNVVGGNVSDGVVCINGERLNFIGGALGAEVVIIETDTPLNFFDDATQSIVPINVVKNRIATFGVSGSLNPYLWANFKRNDPNNGLLQRVDKIEKMLKPLLGYDDPNNPGTTVYGSWMFWGRPAAEIPDGWQAVPDAEWKGKFPVVMDNTDADFIDTTITGGSKTKTIAQANLPAVQIDVPVPKEATNGDGGGIGPYLTTGHDPENIEPGPTLKTANLGNGTPLNILPPYKVVMFIRFIG
ncbi:MAG: hypothetical protein C0459_03475 [Chitinophaga sp.]|jgi:hypothetical protein|nr:hypothetical protein [Chitinophaga sp.]